MIAPGVGTAEKAARKCRVATRRKSGFWSARVGGNVRSHKAAA